MNLVWFEVEGYKRFFNKSKINLDGKLVAIVGPNEAGKTSLLRCLHHISTNEAFSSKGAAQEITRGKDLSKDHVVAEWTFALDAADHAALSAVPDAETVRWYVVRKKVDGAFTHSVRPRPSRSLKQRQDGLRKLQALIEVETPEVADENEEREEAAELKLCQKVAAGIATETETLSETTIERIKELAELLSVENDRLTDQVLASELTSLYEFESLDCPADRILDHLWKSKPQLLFFGQDDRALESEYNIRPFFFEDRQHSIQKQPIPIALRNLAAAAGLNLQSLYAAQTNDDRGKVRTILEAAEETINSSLRGAWTQDQLTVSLELDQFRLQILLKSQKGEYVKVIERSEGLRQFLALLMFLSKRESAKTRPIVLIDEAEIHLHYDAQADLVQTLARQSLAAKVIYTTHSAGCLPEDLGSGVRMVATDPPYSTIENWFWDSDRPGFSPLLFAMGANTLAFVPMRYAVVGEGAADMILVPAIIKTVLKLDSVGFQVVPGLSSCTAEQIGIIDSESTRTIYLVDGDSAGRRMRAKILEAGVSEDRIVDLPNLNGSDTVIEDYVAIDTYLKCVNVDLKMSGCAEISAEEMPRPNRPKHLENWCKKHGKSIPSKRSVAYRIVDEKHENNIVDELASDAVKELHSKIVAALKLE